MRMRHYIIMVVMLLLTIIVSSCKKNNGGDPKPEPKESHIIVRVDKTEVVATEGVCEVGIEIEHFGDLATLNVAKETQYGRLVKKFAKNKLLDKYTHVYIIQPTDPKDITLEFFAEDKNGGVSKAIKVKVTNNSEVSDARLGMSNLQCISRVTGAESYGNPDIDSRLPKVKFVVNNNTHTRFDVGGTDLGIIWEIEPGRYGLFFGDTVGKNFLPQGSVNGGNWRNNVLLFSTDTDLEDGLTITGAVTDMIGNAKEVVYGGKTEGNGSSIPTGVVRANGADYVHYMNIKSWDDWSTNFSSMYKSTDKAYNWSALDHVKFTPTSNFGQVGYYNDNGTVYMIGTQPGRQHFPHLARFNEKDIENPLKYEFWIGNGWVKGREDCALPLFEDRAGELSFAYMPKLKKWILMYISDVTARYEISLRYSNRPEGPWSQPIKVASGWQWPELYGSFIHPLSQSGTKVYFTMSLWYPYNSYLMSIDLELLR